MGDGKDRSGKSDFTEKGEEHFHFNSKSDELMSEFTGLWKKVL